MSTYPITLHCPANLLEACLYHDGARGGTIHAYLPRLRWVEIVGGFELYFDSLPIGKWMADDVCAPFERPEITPNFPSLCLYIY